MPAFVYPVSSLIIIIISLGIYELLIFSSNYLIKKDLSKPIIAFAPIVLVAAIGIYSLKPGNIANHRSITNELRNSKISNTKIYKSLKNEIVQNYVVLNCKSFKDINLMFYKDLNAYHWHPENHTLDSLQRMGYKFAAFKNHNNQHLPEYIFNDKKILIIDEQLK